MAFNGKEGGEIPLATAAEMTAAYRAQNPNETLAHYFGKDIILQILAQEKCVGIRIYYGLNRDGGKELILVGVDSQENDLTDFVADMSLPCPKACSTSNALNS